ncbi:hypothetical protein [Vibrio vulnificus YJ016]|uniref:Uncharacterized protein n=1 Tax=Vibrio vulnificus (strain YJ016) TaxID=196600 RepID=Q7MIT9_VIBVY|nr:hypothetical protein [Vibrio vulnificus YJ016]
MLFSKIFSSQLMEDLFSQRFRSIAKDKNSNLRVWIKPHITTTVDKKLVVPIFSVKVAR